MFVLGGRSDYVEPQHHADIEPLFPPTVFDTIAGACHWSHADAPKPLVERVNHLLADARTRYDRATATCSGDLAEGHQVGVSVSWNTWFEATVARKVLPLVLETVE